MIKIGILGASGYTGVELIRLLLTHPHAQITALTAERHADKEMGDVFPHLAHLNLPRLVKVDAVDFGALDFVFAALPHGTTQNIISRLRREHPDLPICDLSADFRLRDIATYETWYGDHLAQDLQSEAVYGLTEQYRADIAGAKLVANPGCYTTTSELPLIPLLEQGLISGDGIIIDAKSGVSGAGRAPKEGTLHTEVAEGFHAYGIASHRHAPEIDQELSAAAGRPVKVTFTPHLLPQNRGILATIYCQASCSADEAREALTARYADEPFVTVLAKGGATTRHARGSNLCAISVHDGPLDGQLILCSATDNLVKGASGQAIQNMNVQLGLEETLGLPRVALFP